MAPKEEFKPKSNSKSVMNAPKGGKVRAQREGRRACMHAHRAGTAARARTPRGASSLADAVRQWAVHLNRHTSACWHSCPSLLSRPSRDASPPRCRRPAPLPAPRSSAPQAKDAKRAEAKAKKLEKAGFGAPSNLTKK